MPIYEFECKNWREKFETLVRLGDKKDIQCPACSSCLVARIMSTFSCLGGAVDQKTENGSRRRS